MTTSTKELIQRLEHEAKVLRGAMPHGANEWADNCEAVSQRLRELDKPDCVWTPLITTVETNVNFYKQRCVTNIMVREMPTKLTPFCSNCGGAVKSGGTPNE
jgi:hypothetical protein